MQDLPRSVRLAAWGTAVLAGAATPEAAVAAVTGDDEPHDVATSGDLPGLGTAGPLHPAGLSELLAAMAALRVPGLRVVLPAPGDVLGLPGPPAFNADALEAGECVLAQVSGDDAWGVVPQVVHFGSRWEPGVMVTWQVHRTLPRRVTDVGSVSEAERALREALMEATDLLTRLDVSRWREDAADRISAIRDGALPRHTLPPSAPGRCVQVLATAARVAAIVELAAEDDGAAITSHEALRRREALSGLAAVSRRAVVAAVNGLLEPR